MCSPAAPTPPSPQATAAAQTTSNRETAITQTGLNSTNQVTPGGTLTYEQIGKWEDGTPRFQATTALTPAGQQIYDTSQQTTQNLANVAKEQSGRLSGLLSTPFSLDNDATEARINELASKRLDPMLARRQTALDTRLSNQGIKLGSTAWDRAQESNLQGENDARNQLLLTGRNQAVSEALLQRQTPINEILALAGQGQIAQPQFGSTPQTGVAGTDVAGITQAGYQNSYNSWNQQNQQNQQMLGGLFGLAGNAALAFSDRRLKRNIKRIGTAKNGLPIYHYQIDGRSEVGFLADEVRKVRPEAVFRHPSGFDMVNYERAVA
jgi:hypothetical protein